MDESPPGPSEINEGRCSAADQHRSRQNTCQNVKMRSPRSMESCAGGRENVPSRPIPTSRRSDPCLCRPHCSTRAEAVLA